ncbi:MAG: glycoside hydrolase family 26 protein [Candidatus Heimdallarchaeaceae archaeon]
MPKIATAQTSEESSCVYDKADWIKDALNSIIAGKYPRIKSVSYWNEEWENGIPFPPSDLRINSSDSALQAYRNGISNPIFTTDVEWNITNNDYKLLPPSQGIYHAAYPDFNDSEDYVRTNRITDFEQLAGKSIIYAYFSNNWYDGIKFPEESVKIINSTGKIPYVRLMARSIYQDEGGDPIYTLQRIIDGDFDANLTQWALDYNATQIPIIAEFGTEVNGPWFPWNGYWAGGENTTEYGDPNLPDGPERFRDAYRHIIDIFRNLNVRNITWVYHVDDFIDEDNPWNNMSAYYPGDDYIDWIGISVYGPLDFRDEWISFTDLMDEAYPKLCSISANKPLALLEWGADEHGGTKMMVYFKTFVVPSIVGISVIIAVTFMIVKRARRKRKGM